MSVEKDNMLISIIMGVFNCQDTLDEAIGSILDQTYANWEFIICDDGSSDNTFEIAKKYADRYPEKFILIKNEKNMGLNYTLNECLKRCNGDFVARMDGDDISHPERFAREVEALLNNEGIDIVSADMEFFDEGGIWGKTRAKQFPNNGDFVKGSPFCHAPCMVRKRAYDAVEGYSVSKKLLRVEDYHLWTKMYIAGFRGMNIQEPLYRMRDDRQAVKRRKFRFRVNESRVKAYAIKGLRLPKRNYVYCLKPLIVGLLPTFLYKILHKLKNR